MNWFDKPNPTNFKKINHGLGYGCWNSKRNELCYGVLVKEEKGELKQSNREEKAKEKADERIKAIEEKKKWYKDLLKKT